MFSKLRDRINVRLDDDLGWFDDNVIDGDNNWLVFSQGGNRLPGQMGSNGDVGLAK